MMKMKYSTYRHLIKNGDLLVYSGDGFFGRLVKLFTRSEYSHVSIVLWVGNRLFALEVYPPKILLKPVSEFNSKFLVPMNIKNWKETYTNELLKPIGNNYNFISAFFGLFNLAHIVDTDHSDYWQCAHYVSYFYKDIIGLDFGWQETPKLVVEKALELSKSELIKFNS